MPQVFGNSIKVSLWIVVSLLFVSHNVLHNDLEKNTDVDGTYLLKTSGAYDLELNGDIRFKRSVEIAASGKSFVTLELSLQGGSELNSHSIGFLISRKDRKKPIDTGTYRISRNIKGFLAPFDGVFGFANMEAAGELPYFAREGKISIYKITPDKLFGSVDIEMKNPNDKQLIIKGDFIAVREME